MLKMCISTGYLRRWLLKLAETAFAIITRFKVLLGVSNLFLKSQHAIPSSPPKGNEGGGGGGGDSNSTAKWTHPLDKGTCLTKYRTLPSWISLLHSTHSSIHSSCLSLRHISWNSNSEWQRRCTRWRQEATARVKYVSTSSLWHFSTIFFPRISNFA
jgi:hypothetical protein